MIPRELAKKIRYIEISTKKAVNDVLAGEYGSLFKGRGMEFDEVREYVPGDEVRSIDWNVTAKMGHPYVKRYVEERELSVVFLVDLSASGAFGTVDKTKNELAAELCALLSFSAIKNNDKVSLIAFTDGVEMFIPPKKGLSHVLRLIRALLFFKPKKAKTDLVAALDYLAKLANKRSVVFVISDFQAEGFEKPLAILSRKHDLIALLVGDPLEREIPDVGLLELEDLETGETVLIDSSDAALRGDYATLSASSRQELKALFRKLKVDFMEVTNGDDYLKSLLGFFRRRRGH